MRQEIYDCSNCKVFTVIPKFLAFNLPNTNDNDSRFFRKRLLRSALKKRKNEQYKLDKELLKISIEVYHLLSVNCMVKTTIRTQEKKLKELTRNVILPFTPAETVLNLSTTRLSDIELERDLKRWIETFH